MSRLPGEILKKMFNFFSYCPLQRISSDNASTLPKRDVRFILLK